MLHNRHSIRLPGYDYSQEGCYFITIVTHEREPIFGTIVADEMELSDLGRIVELTWRDLELHNPDIGLDEFVIMPNHIHGIIQIFEQSPCRGGSVTRPESFIGKSLTRPITRNRTGLPLSQQSLEGAKTAGPAPTIESHKRTPLSEIVRQFKTFSAKRINEIRGTQGAPVWQRNYYEHIIGSDQEYEKIAAYIAENPMNWMKDEEENM